MEDLHRLHGDRVHVLNIYTLEAHPIDGRPMNYSYDAQGNPIEQPVTYAERVDMALKTIAEANLTLPVLVDDMDNPVYCSYGRVPNNAYFIATDGTVLVQQAWSNPAEIEAAIQEYFSGQP